jgi:hypothetical protein
MDAFSDLKVGLVLSPPPALTHKGLEGATESSWRGATTEGMLSPLARPSQAYPTTQRRNAPPYPKDNIMQILNLDQAGDVLAAMTITRTIDAGHAIVHIGTDEHGRRIVLVNDCNGDTAITTSQ